MIKRFKTFLSEGLLKEDLTYRQKSGFRDYARYNYGIKIPNVGPTREALRISQRVMPEGTDSIVIPARNSLLQRVHDHLTQHGYSIKDYANQLAEKNGRPIKIGKVLSQTKADKSLMNDFAGDNHAESAEFTKKHAILISRVPDHIAQCSTNDDNPNIWSSCAKLDWNGEPVQKGHADGKLAAQLLPHAIKSGSHVAYLVPNDKDLIDENSPESHQKLIDKASVRVMLHPFHGNDNNETVLVPEGRTYSKMDQKPSGFRETVEHFTDTHFPMNTGELYNKNESIYNDDGMSHRVKIDLDTPFDSGYNRYDMQNFMEQQRHITPEHISKFVSDVKNNPDHPNAHLLQHIPHLPNVTGDHLSHFIKPENWQELSSEDKTQILTKKFNKQDHEQLHKNLYTDLHDPYKQDSFQIGKYVNNAGTRSEHIKDLLLHPALQVNARIYTSEVRRPLLTSNKLKGNDLTEIVNKAVTNPEIYGKVIHNDNLTKEHVYKLLDNGLHTDSEHSFYEYTNIKPLANKDTFSADDIHEMLDHVKKTNPNDYTRTSINHSLLQNPNFNHEHLSKLIDNGGNSLHHKLHVTNFINKNYEDDDIHNVLIDKVPHHNYLSDTMSGMARHLSEENINKVLNKTNTLKGQYTRNLFVQNVLDNPDLNSSHMYKLTHHSIFNDLGHFEKNKILKHPEFTSEHLSDMIDNIKDYFTEDQRAIINHPKFNTSDMSFSSQRHNEPNHFDYITEPKNWNDLHDRMKALVLSHPRATPENIKNMKSRIKELSPQLQVRLTSHPLYNQ